MNILLLNEWGFRGVGTELYTQVVYRELLRFGANVVKVSIRDFDYDVKVGGFRNSVLVVWRE